MKQKNKMISLWLWAIILFFMSYQSVYSMEDISVKLKEKLQISNAKQYEMNIVLEELNIKEWDSPTWHTDERDGIYDEPMGEYSVKELEKYTDEELDVVIEYCCGNFGHAEGANDLIQIIRIYDKDELVVFDYHIWYGKQTLRGNESYLDEKYWR